MRTLRILAIVGTGLMLLSEPALSQTYEPGFDPRKIRFECQTYDEQFEGEDELNNSIKENWGHKRYLIIQTSDGPFADINRGLTRFGEFDLKVYDRDTGKLIHAGSADGERTATRLVFRSYEGDEPHMIKVSLQPDDVKIKRSSISLAGESRLHADCSDLFFF